jgi:hypothetical protein
LIESAGVVGWYSLTLREETGVKVIIAGGRNVHFEIFDILFLDRLHEKYKFTEIISGGATGIDEDAEIYAEDIGIPVKRFPADWKKYGRAAGPIRNAEMARYADAVILFPGGRGTANMRECAVRHGIKVFSGESEQCSS